MNGNLNSKARPYFRPIQELVPTLWITGVLTFFVVSFFLPNKITSLPWSQGFGHDGWFVLFAVWTGGLFIVNAWLRVNSEGRLKRFREEYEQELELERKKRAEESRLGSLGRMSAGIAHEINNPLAVISARLDYLKSNLTSRELMDAKLEKDFSALTRQLGRISEIVDKIRAMSANAHHESLSQVELAVLVRQSIENFSTRLGIKQIVCEMEFPAEPLFIHCRPEEIAFVFNNLIENSIDAIESLQDRWIKITATTQGNTHVIQIQDSGPRIPEEIADKLMDPFFTTKEIGKGTGLGLAVCQTTLRHHGGEISYDPTASHATFVLRLPTQNPFGGIS